MIEPVSQYVLCGISGAPGVGKTTVVSEVIARASHRCTFALSSDVARSLVRQGVRINTESQADDYLAFLAVRLHEMLELRSDLVVHERTLLDVLAFMELNGHAQGWLNTLTEELVRWQMGQLTLYFYIPIEFEARDDGTRIIDPATNRRFDQILVALLRKYKPDFITLTGSVAQRADSFFQALAQAGLDLS
jgi:predicted ATPase